MFSALTKRILDPPTFGLDISDFTVKFMRISSLSPRTRIGYFGEIELPPKLVVNGEVKDESALANVLREELLGSGVGHKAVIASLPEEKSFVRVLEIPRMKLEDVGKAIRWELEGVIPLPISEMVYDFEVVSSSSLLADHLDVLVIAFPRQVIESYERVLAQAGFVLSALELESQAISRALLSDSASQPPLVMLDIGAARTSIIVFAGGSLLFTKSIEVAGYNFDKSIASALAVSLEEGRQLKIDIGLNKHYGGGKVFQALEPFMKTLVSELESTLRFYRDHPRKTHSALADIATVVLAGGDANLIGLERYLTIAVRLPVMAGDPFKNLNFGPGAVPPIPKNESLKYTTAIGLALRAM